MSDKPASPYAHIAALPLGIAASVWVAYTMTYWWQWFVVPLGLPTISTVHAYALCGAGWFFSRGIAFGLAERADVLAKHDNNFYVIGKPIMVSAIAGALLAFFYVLHRLM